jgi:NAD(P)-dependent dehydrogenase (short-subunit alcohol dehydrogenase family)
MPMKPNVPAGLSATCSRRPLPVDRGWLAIAGDVADPAMADALVDLALDSFGGLHAVVCNAGIDVIRAAVEYSTDE